jgi:ABC-type multidrug transport system permease subunit
VSVRINGVVDRLARYTSPALIDVELDGVDEEASQSGGIDIGRLFLPGILLMALLFMSQGLAADLWQEREQGTLRRIVTTPRSAALVLVGKLLTAAIVIGIVSAVAIGIAVLRYDVRPSMFPLAIAWATLTGVVLVVLQMIIHVHTRSARAANLVSMAVIFPLMMLGGSFFPFELMPNWMATIGRLTPNGWALARLKEIAWGEPHAPDLVVGAAVLVAVGLVLFALTARRLRTRFAGG